MARRIAAASLRSGGVLLALLLACSDLPSVSDAPTSVPGTAAVTAASATAQPTVAVAIAGRVFQLELAIDRSTRYRGLGGRTWIDPHGGMLFPYAKSGEITMVMRDCPVPIDVAFLDGDGRVVALHAMQPEAARLPAETPFQYNARLTGYASGVPARFAVEVAGGRLEDLGVRVGDLFAGPWDEF